MSPDPASTPLGQRRHTVRTLPGRAAIYFGVNNVMSLRVVRLGRGRVAFAGPTRLWLYEERNGRRFGTVVNLTEKMRDELVDALVEF